MVQSTSRNKIPGGNVRTKPSGKSAFRFLVSRQSALDDPRTAKFAQLSGELIIWFGPDRRVVMYPCSDNKMLNFVCIHPREDSEGKTDGEWGESTRI